MESPVSPHIFFLILVTTLRGRYRFFSSYKWGSETALWLSAFLKGTPLGSAPAEPICSLLEPSSDLGRGPSISLYHSDQTVGVDLP